MTLKISSLKANLAREVEGDWITYPRWKDIRFNVSAFTKPSYQTARDELHQRVAKKNGGVLPGRVGNRHPLSTPFGCFTTSDGQVVIAVLNGGQFQRLAGLIGKPEIAADPRFASDSSRTEHEPALRALIEAWSRGLTTEQAVAALAAEGLPTAPIWDIAQAADNEHAATRGLVSTLAHPVLGRTPIVGQPVRFDGAKPVAATAAPRLGGDIETVLKEFGLEALRHAD